MKKLLLALGSIGAVAAPIASVVACGAPAPKHVSLDKAKIKRLLPDLKSAIEKAMSIPEGTLDSATDTETPDATGFDVTLTKDATSIDIEVTADGEVTGLRINSNEANAGQISAVQTVMKGGTVDKSTQHIDKVKFVIDDYDQTIMRVVINAGTPLPSIADGADYNTISDYNTDVSAFVKLYNQEVAKEALEVISTSTSGVALSKTREELGKLGFSSMTLSTSDVDELGLPASKSTKLKKLIGFGANIQISITEYGDLSGIVFGLKDESKGSFSWIMSTKVEADRFTFAVNAS